MRLFLWVVRLVVCHLGMRLHGFSRRLDSHGIVFWTRLGKGDESATGYRDQNPLFIMHGLGFGCVPYAWKAMWIARTDPSRTVVLPEWPNISYGTWRGRYPSSREITCTLHRHLRRIAGGGASARASVIAHSYGTAILTYWLREFPDDLRKRVYIDPICVGATFGTYFSYGYERRLHTLRSLYQNSDEPIVELLIKGELSLQQVGKRGTWLMELLEADVSNWSRDAMVILSGRDPIVRCDSTKAWLKEIGCGVKVVIEPDWIHGGAVIQNDPRRVWERLRMFVFGKPTKFASPSYSLLSNAVIAASRAHSPNES